MLCLVGVVTLVLFWYWHMYTTSTSAIIEVIEVREKEMVVKGMDGETTVVRIPQATHQLINKNEYYFVNYECRRWEKTPKLTKIEPY